MISLSVRDALSIKKLKNQYFLPRVDGRFENFIQPKVT